MKTIRRDQLRAGFVQDGEFVRVINDDGSTHAYIIVPSDDRPQVTEPPPPCPRCAAIEKSVRETAKAMQQLIAKLAELWNDYQGRGAPRGHIAEAIAIHIYNLDRAANSMELTVGGGT